MITFISSHYAKGFIGFLLVMGLLIISFYCLVMIVRIFEWIFYPEIIHHYQSFQKPYISQAFGGPPPIEHRDIYKPKIQFHIVMILLSVIWPVADWYMEKYVYEIIREDEKDGLKLVFPELKKKRHFYRWYIPIVK